MKQYSIFIILSLMIWLSWHPGALGQETEQQPRAYSQPELSDLSSLSPQEYLNFELPPLQALLDNAVRNPLVLQSEAVVDAAKYDLKAEKLNWLSYISARAGYSYGILGTYSDRETEYTPLTTVYSGSSQSSYSIGATIAIPLNHLASRGAMIKRQRKVVEQAEYGKELALNSLKNEIIEHYSKLQSTLAIIKLRAEALVFFNANYKIMENDFVNGKATATDLAGLKREQKNALEEYESLRADLNTLILQLEILTNMKLVNNKKQ